MTNHKLKVGVIIDCNFVKDFEYEFLKDLNRSKFCETHIYATKVKTKLQNTLLLDAYLKFDKIINARGKDHFSKKSIDDLGIKTVTSLDENFDLFVNFSDGKVNALSKHGTWELRYGEAQSTAKKAGIDEVFNESCTTVITLHRLRDKLENSYIIDKFLCATHELSPVKNRSDVLWRSHDLLFKNIEKLALKKTINTKDLCFFKDKDIKDPKILDTLLSLFKHLLRNFTFRVDKLLKKQQWSVYFAINKEGSNFNQNMSSFKEIPTPKEFFWADPFVVDKDDKSYIFFEEYVYKTHKGHLCVIEYDHKSEIFSQAKEILNTPYHLSYPFIMEYNNNVYMIPEGSKDKDIKLYKATNFPHDWELIKVLLKDIVAVDTTIFKKDGLWWMFANVSSKDEFSLNEELNIYYCEDFLKDEWEPHVQNPVVSSLQTSRPAGSIMEYNGDYYRPSQNSVGWYGKSTNFNKIITLTKDEYKEEFISEITPNLVDGIYAVHTYNSSKKLTVIDGLKKIRRFF